MLKMVAAIPTILRDRESSKNDRIGRKFKTYIGKRGKKKDTSETSTVNPPKGEDSGNEPEEPTLSRKEILDQLEEDDDDGEN